MSTSLAARAPWWVKIPAKIVLSRLPVPYRLWRRLNLFRHGFMTDPAYAERVFLTHLAERGPDAPPGFTCLELGPGDSLLSALVARKHGAACTYLVDVGDFAARDPELYRQAARAIAGAAAGADDWRSVEDMLDATGATYLTDGVRSLETIPAGSVDFVWSQAVLEHVRRETFPALLRQLHRIMRPGAVASHRVDLRDHLGGRLDNLRFSPALWESELFASSGFYTNRLRYSEILELCRDAGFVVRETKPDFWPAVPTARSAMHPRFSRFADDDLRVHGFYLTLTRP